jgi:hypothetical protein
MDPTSTSTFSADILSPTKSSSFMGISNGDLLILISFISTLSISTIPSNTRIRMNGRIGMGLDAWMVGVREKETDERVRIPIDDWISV